jgi:hypothetical protein
MLPFGFYPRHLVTLALIAGLAGCAAFLTFAQGSYAAGF